MKTDKEDMLKTYNEFKALCLDKGYEFKFEGIQQYVNGRYAVLRYWHKDSNPMDGMEITKMEEEDVLTTMKKLYEYGIESLIKYE